MIISRMSVIGAILYLFFIAYELGQRGDLEEVAIAMVSIVFLVFTFFKIKASTPDVGRTRKVGGASMIFFGSCYFCLIAFPLEEPVVGIENVLMFTAWAFGMIYVGGFYGGYIRGPWTAKLYSIAKIINPYLK